MIDTIFTCVIGCWFEYTVNHYPRAFNKYNITVCLTSLHTCQVVDSSFFIFINLLIFISCETFAYNRYEQKVNFEICKW